MSPNDPEPIFRPRRHLPPTRRSIFVIIVTFSLQTVLPQFENLFNDVAGVPSRHKFPKTPYFYPEANGSPKTTVTSTDTPLSPPDLPQDAP
mmetsp:Transcript_12554/g.38375  ORF Transcript_12554/g.38375 Transcript_12554/m.38375 type:complete len:91 (-) Transcript_12554:270-542(-)